MRLQLTPLVALAFAALVTHANAQEPTAPPPSAPPPSAPPPSAPASTQEPAPPPAPPSPPPAQDPAATPPAPDTAASDPHAASHESSYDVRAASELATYGDTDHVFVVSPSISATVAKPASGWNVSGSYLVDVVSAASVDIVSTASRRFDELRHAGSLGGGYQIGKLGLSATTSVSIEPDYQSYTGGASATYDLFDKNFTALVAYYHGYDIAGRHDTPWNVWNHQIDTNGVKLGGTILLGPRTFLAIVGDLIFENGDTSKPYRYVPLFAPGTVVPNGATIDQVTSLRTSERELEQLPTARDRYALSARLGHRFGGATLRLDERLYTDTWNLHASTTDARLLFDIADRVETGPHLRFHAQSAVDFWQRAYTVGPGLNFPALRTGDRELGPLLNMTGGGSVRVFLGPTVDPRTFAIGLDANVTTTQYTDDIYITQRTSAIIALTLEKAL